MLENLNERCKNQQNATIDLLSLTKNELYWIEKEAQGEADPRWWLD